MPSSLPILAAILACLTLQSRVSVGQELSLETLNSRLSELETTVQQLAERECACGESQAEHVIAFSVTMDNPSVHSVNHTIIPFSNVKTNVGNGYSTITNVFTVPKDGVYVFFAHLDCSLDYLLFTIARNGFTNVAMAHNDQPGGHSLSTYVIIALNAGDIIDVRHGENKGSIDGGPESMFAGFRLGPIPSAAPIVG